MAKTLKCIIIEDGEQFSKLLKRQLQNTGYPIVIEKVCENVQDGLAAIDNFAPDLVFLDIWLHGNEKGGFELLYQIDEIPFDVIFTTAHVDDNISEIRRCGLYLLMKPYLQKEVNEAMERYFGALEKDRLPKKTDTLKANLLQENVQDKIVFINVGVSEFPIKIKDIIYFTFSEPTLSWFFYSNNERLVSIAKNNLHQKNLIFHTKENKPNRYEYIEFRQRMPMKSAERDFKSLQFLSVHKSFLVNVHHIVEFTSRNTRDSEVIMSNGETLPASDNGRKLFYEMTGKQNFSKK